jgi:hypothetical protein
MKKLCEDIGNEAGLRGSEMTHLDQGSYYA